MNALCDNPWLHLPLDGVHLIEASAGTGKTFTLATLFIRLLVERQLNVSQILTVTFTEAATQELRKRIRERLLLAVQLVNQPIPSQSEAAHETQLTSAILWHHLDKHQESAQALARRLQRAAEEMDLAAIFTIHGFCMRVLSEHALDSDYGFIRSELLLDPTPLEQNIAHDLWRQHANHPQTLEALTRLWPSPQALAASIRELSGPLPLFPPCPEKQDKKSPQKHLDISAQALAQAVLHQGEAYARQILDAIDAGILNKTSYRKEAIALLLTRLLEWARQQPVDVRALRDLALDKITHAALVKGTKKSSPGNTPVSPLQPLIADYLDAQTHWQDWQQHQTTKFLHAVRETARARMAALKQQRHVHTYDDLIERVATALQGKHATALIQALRKQYKTALVDEFQDTDARQWSIFKQVFADHLEPSLFLIGDPKQAIYGFRGGDVETYLRAKQDARIAPALEQNFRSRPSLLRAIECLYNTAGDMAFVTPDIQFIKVFPGGVCQDSDYLVNGEVAPGLTLHRIESPDGVPLKADASRAEAARACVAEIARVLSAAHQQTACIRNQAVEPGDIAVLVRNHREAALIQHALTIAGIPAVTAGKSRLFATDEARDIHTLLVALLHLADERRLHAALATVLIGFDGAQIAAQITGPGAAATRHAVQQRALLWYQRWQRGGIFALVNDICAEQARRLLALNDGERRLTNYLQLAEHLQTASINAAGMQGSVDWLQQQMASDDTADEAHLLRLESDARRVQIVTLHKSKGLEYPLVYLPFVSIGRTSNNTPNHHIVQHHGQRQLHWKINPDNQAWTWAKARAADETRCEEARLLYVGLTRAVQALWIATGDLYEHANSVMAPMLEHGRETLAMSPDIAIVSADNAFPARTVLAAPAAPIPPARRVQRHIVPDWWIHSFTQLVRQEGRMPESVAAGFTVERAASDESVAQGTAQTAFVVETGEDDLRFSGSRFGNVLHAALETSRFAAWCGWQTGMPCPAGEESALRKALGREGYHDKDEQDGLGLLTRLVGHSLTVALPEGGMLCTLPDTERRAELEFHFHLHPTRVQPLIQLLHTHGITPTRHGFAQRQRLNGLLTGKIDLTYVRDGRWYVLDYKSNRLPQYDQPALVRAMQHSEYDLQALLYTLALHRWLRFRLRDGYDYQRNVGGIRYLFCRGLEVIADAPPDHCPGLFSCRFAPELISALDALFSGQENPP